MFERQGFSRTGLRSNSNIRCALSNIASTLATVYSSQAMDSGKESFSQEGSNMRSGYRYFFSSVFLTAALAAPAAISYAAGGQDNGRQEEHRDNDHNRVYDREHGDYHNWDGNEDRVYRQYLVERHRAYRPFVEIKVRDQRAYWNWRHSHEDHDHDGR
jgi:hypothetical protein